MTPETRKLLSEVVTVLNDPSGYQPRYLDDIQARARAALAAPQQPSDEEWDALVESLWDRYETVGYQGERFMYSGDFGTACDLLREEIMRYGAQAVPVPVAERVPRTDNTGEAVIRRAILGGEE